MRLRFSILLIGLAVACSFAGFAAPAQSNGARAAKPSDVREIDLDGLKKILHRDPKDTRPLLINFWATWCDGCREAHKRTSNREADKENGKAQTHSYT